MRHTFSKSERLNSRKLIGELFANGHSFYNYPFKVIQLNTSGSGSVRAQVLISVSKRNFKKAVDRNKIKRLVREAYRKHKNLIPEPELNSEKQLLIGLIYTGKTILEYAEIERKIILILQRLIEQDEQAAG